MSGLLNSLFPAPSIPHGRSKSPVNPQLARLETEIINDCIAETRTKTLDIEQHIKSLNANIVTVCRCINARLPPFSPRIPIRLPEYRTGSLPLAIESAKKTLTHQWQTLHRQIAQIPPVHQDQLQSPTYSARKPSIVNPEEPMIPPNNFDANAPALTKQPPEELQAELTRLVLKKAQLEVEADNLERDLLFWGGIFEELNLTSFSLELKEEPVRLKSVPMPAGNMKRPSLIRRTAKASGPAYMESSCSTPKTSTPMITSNIRRKEVPIRAMIERVKTSLPWAGSSKEGSWAGTGNNRTMTERGDNEKFGFDVPTGPDCLRQSMRERHEQKQRGDSGVDMSADVEKAKTQLRDRFRGLRCIG